MFLGLGKGRRCIAYCHCAAFRFVTAAMKRTDCAHASSAAGLAKAAWRGLIREKSIIQHPRG
jgi:hypothetical protein